MTAKIEGNKLVIEIPLLPVPRQTPRSQVIAETGKFQTTEAVFQGKSVGINLTACVR